MTDKIENVPATPTDELELQDRFAKAGRALVNEIIDDLGRGNPEEHGAIKALVATGMLSVVAEVVLSNDADTFPASVHVYTRWPDGKNELHLLW
jgi:hypothetical protein